MQGKGKDVFIITRRVTVLSRDYIWTVSDALRNCLLKCNEPNASCSFTFFITIELNHEMLISHY